MAEIVQQVIESSIQDLSILEKYNLFDSTEIKAILKKRREFEYRLRKVKKSKDDFLRYISYEESLLKLVRIRREKSGLEIDRNEVEKNILDHIRTLFEFTINKFKSDIALWLSYINFSRSQNQLDHVSIIYFRMLQVHNKNWLWLKFAKFEFEDKASSETARKVFLKAVSFHSDSKQIWHEYFRFEMLYCSKIKKRFQILTNGIEESEMNDLNAKQSDDAIWKGKLALIVYKHAINAFEDFEFAAKFIDLCNKFNPETTKDIKESIFDDLKLRFGSCEDFSNLKALDKLQEYKLTVRFTPKMSESDQLKSKQEALGEAISIYETACLNFNNTKMWSFYIYFCLDELKSISDPSMLAQKISEIIYTIDKLWKEEKVSFEIFQEWIKLMYSCNKKDAASIQKLHKLLKEASDRWPENLQAHLFIACIMTKLPDKKIIDSVIDKFFQDSLFRKFTRIDEQNVEMITDFYELYLDWSVQNKMSYHKIMKIVNQLNTVCIYAPRKMSDHFKSKILAIFYHIFGIEKARLYYETNKNVSPICKGFSYKMIEIEKHFAEMQEEGSADLSSKITSIYEDLIHHFGSEDIKIWLSFIQHTIAVDLTRVGQLYEKALKSLNASDCQQFVQQYSLLKSMPPQAMECEFICA